MDSLGALAISDLNVVFYFNSGNVFPLAFNNYQNNFFWGDTLAFKRVLSSSASNIYSVYIYIKKNDVRVTSYNEAY